MLCFFFLTKHDISTGLIKVCNFCTVKKISMGWFCKKKVSRVLISMLLLSLLFHAISVGAKKRDNGWMKDKIDRQDNEKWQFLNANYLLWRHYESHSLKSKRSCCINLYFGNS